jgi:hypothetical protein
MQMILTKNKRYDCLSRLTTVERCCTQGVVFYLLLVNYISPINICKSYHNLLLVRTEQLLLTPWSGLTMIK